MESKTCSKCGETKSICDFHAEKQNIDGLRSICKKCVKEYQREYISKNKESIREKANNRYLNNKEFYNNKNREWYEKNKDKVKEYNKKYRDKNIDEIKAKILKRRKDDHDHIIILEKKSRERNADKKLKRDKKYREDNKDKIKEYKRLNRNKINTQVRKRRKDDIEFRISLNLRNSLKQALRARGIRKRTTIDVLCGCSRSELKIHIESLFADGMTWENYGINGWHIDHIKPVAAFRLTDLEQQKACFCYKNLQPLWAADNFIKNSFYNGRRYRLGKSI